jgi:hypothetical protein
MEPPRMERGRTLFHPSIWLREFDFAAGGGCDVSGLFVFYFLKSGILL